MCFFGCSQYLITFELVTQMLLLLLIVILYWTKSKLHLVFGNSTRQTKFDSWNLLWLVFFHIFPYFYLFENYQKMRHRWHSRGLLTMMLLLLLLVSLMHCYQMCRCWHTGGLLPLLPQLHRCPWPCLQKWWDFSPNVLWYLLTILVICCCSTCCIPASIVDFHHLNVDNHQLTRCLCWPSLRCSRRARRVHLKYLKYLKYFRRARRVH